jgi:uncharacterized protein YciI
MPEQKIYHVVLHHPGPKWQPGVDFRQQEGIAAHVTHYARWHSQAKLHMGGPFLDVDRGGMMVAERNVTREELEAYAAEDPAVQSGLLTFEIIVWYVPMEA